MIIPTTLQIKPEVAIPILLSFVITISFFAFWEIAIPITPRIKPINGIRIERIPRVKELIELLFVRLLITNYISPFYY